MPNLIVERGREKGASYPLVVGSSMVIGRDPTTAQVVIADAAASRRHFQVSHRDGKWFVADLGSKNFTFVNEEKCDREIELTSGDRIQVGETVFSFLDEDRTQDTQEKAGGLSGREIGGYRILERIGRGGMGTVYKAKQLSLNRLVALKLLSSKFAKDPAFVERFFAEARAAAQLNHPNVVQVFDVGTLSGVHFFSMEFMEGGCVQDLLTAREDLRLPWQEALPLIVDATRGLVFAEKRGIIHRDIKPDNLMLTSEQKVKIGDLGLATRAEENLGTGIFGTPHFIAPEQAQGKDVTHAADLYALGATFYRMVSGRTPFGGQTVKEILRAQINDPHVPLTTEVPGFPEDLSAIVDKLMAKKVEARFQSATALLQELEAFLIAHQIELAGGVKSRKPFLIAMGVLGVALAGVVAWAMLRPKEIETIYKPGETKIVEVGPKGPVKTEEDLRREAEDAATIALLKIRGDDRELRDVDLAEKDAWLAVVAKYEGLRASHERATKQVEEAEARAKEIREEIARLEKLKVEVLDKAKAWWTAAGDAVRNARKERRYGEAIRLAAAALASPELAQFLPHLPANAKPELEGTLDACFSDASQVLAKLQPDAENGIARGEVAEWMKKVEDWETSLRAQEITEPRFAGLAEQARSWRERKSEEEKAKLVEALLADKAAWIETYRKVRRLPRGGDASDDGGAVFSYRFEDAAAELRAAAPRFRTWIFSDRCAAKAEQLAAHQKTWTGFVRLLGEKKVWVPGEDIKGLPGVSPGTKCSIDPDRPPSDGEFYYENTVLGGRTNKTVPWADFTPRELADIFVLPKAERLPPELALPLAAMFAELGEGEAAATLFERSKSAPAAAPWLAAEIAAIQGFQQLLNRVEAKDSDAIRTLEQWRFAHLRSDFFVLVDGRSPADTPQLVTDEDAVRFVEQWGARPK